jgi:hypothetical protein
MKKEIISKEISLIQKSTILENPVLRHFVKKYNLSLVDTVVLGVLLELTGQRKTDIRTHYHIIANQAGISDMEAYQSIISLHRYWIIDWKPIGNFVHISFNEIEEKIEEIFLVQQNAKKIHKLETEVSQMKAKKYVPSDELFDIIMPLVGRIISIKMSETLNALVNYINNKIESATSFKLWKYRFQSYKTGLPLAEIVFRNSLPFIVKEILLIDKKTSILISDASWKGNTGADMDIVAAMLSAITEFIKTSFNKDDSSLNEISFGDSKIFIFESTYFYSAVLVYGNPSADFFNSVDSIFNTIHIKFRSKLKKFNGKMQDLEPIGNILSDFINKANTQTERAAEIKSFTKLKIISVVCTAVIIVAAAIFSIGEIKDYRLEKKILKSLDTSLPQYSHDIAIDVDGKKLTITGVVSSPDIGTAITSIVSAFPELKNIRNKTVSADFRTVEKFKNNISEFEKKFKGLELIFVKQELEKIIIKFPSGVTVLGENQILQTRKIYEILKNYPDIEVDIIAFNDPPGGLEVNKRLAEARMKAISDYLSVRGIDRKKIHITDFNPDVINADPRYREYKDTRGIMLFARQINN